MFICSFDRKAHGPGQKLNKVVVETRKRKYSYQKKKKVLLEEGSDSFPVKDSFEYHESEGFEIVREVDACDECAAKHNKII